MVEVRYLVEPDYTFRWAVCVTDCDQYGFHLYSPLTVSTAKVVDWAKVWDAVDDLLEEYWARPAEPVSARDSVTSMVRVANINAIWWQCRDGAEVTR